MINCVNIRCNILGLAGSDSVQVDINARLDERFFSVRNFIIDSHLVLDIIFSFSD